MDMSVVALYIILRTEKGFHSGIQKLFERNFHEGIKLHIIYFSLTDQNIRTVKIIFSVHVPSIHKHQSSSDQPFTICDIFT